jgi:hypothetical protein
MWKRMRDVGLPRSPVEWAALLLVCVAVLSGNWAADGLKTIVTSLASTSGVTLFTWLYGGLTSVVFGASVVAAYCLRRLFSDVRSLSEQSCKGHEGWILVVSKSNVELTPAFPEFLCPIRRGGDVVVLDGQSLHEDIERLEKLKTNNSSNYWNWQQILRALERHRGRLKRVRLIGSTDGSFDQLESCAELVRRYAPGVVVEPFTRPVDFENFRDLVTVIREVIREEATAKIEPRDMVVDVTGGQKPASAAAAAVTLKSRVRFGYVQTNPRYDVKCYDAVFEAPTSAENP